MSLMKLNTATATSASKGPGTSMLMCSKFWMQIRMQFLSDKVKKKGVNTHYNSTIVPASKFPGQSYFYLKRLLFNLAKQIVENKDPIEKGHTVK